MIRRFLWSYLFCLVFSITRSEKDPDFQLDDHIVVHEEPITLDAFRVFSEKRINVGAFQPA